jgi:hypothetical protein
VRVCSGTGTRARVSIPVERTRWVGRIGIPLMSKLLIEYPLVFSSGMTKTLKLGKRLEFT